MFKLIGNLIELLGSNISAKADDAEDMLPPAPKEEQISNEATSIVGTVSSEPERKEESSKDIVESVTTDSSSEYQKLYKDLFDRYQELLEENTKLKTKLDSLKAIINGE